MKKSYCKHSLSLAISVALFGVAGMAFATTSPSANSPSGTMAGATRRPRASRYITQTPGPQNTNATSNQKQNANGTTTTSKKAEKVTVLAPVKVTGVRVSQMHAIELKRTAPDIQDSITSERIGQLPDVTITDALQRIAGVQIDRVAGVGTSVDVRGLPEVGTLLNGEAFITPNDIDSQQPDFADIPATLIKRVDVVKSPTASLLDSGISGTIDLHTYRPWDLPSGFTYSYSADMERGGITRDPGPQASGLISYNDNGRWGLLLSASVSDTTRENSTEGLDQYGVVLNGENAASADGYGGFVTSWVSTPLPPAIHQLGNGNIDVNNDGKANGVFMGSQDISMYDTATQRRRKAVSASFQGDLGGGFTLTSDLFVIRQDRYDRTHGIQFNSLNWQGATYVPLVSRDTGVAVGGAYAGAYATPQPGWQGMQLYTTQVYKKWPGDTESYSKIQQWNSFVRNFNVAVHFDNGGAFTGTLRGVRDTASQLHTETDINIANARGLQWPNDPINAAPPGVYVYPSELGGNRVFNANGLDPNTGPITADFRGRNMVISMSPRLASKYATENFWSLKTVENGGDYNRSVGFNILRFDGKYNFNDGIVLAFGIRNSVRSAQNSAFDFISPVYAGIGASQPGGCYVKYHAGDEVMDGGGEPGACTAGNAQGFFRSGPLSAQPLSKTPGLLAENFKYYRDVLGSGLSFWAIDPHSMDNPGAYLNALYPGQKMAPDPGASWNVQLKEKSAYLQGNFFGSVFGLQYGANVGLRVIRTTLNVEQFLTGKPRQYGLPEVENGAEFTDRTYTDYLPAANFSLNLTNKLKLRLAYSENMMPLDLSTWGGGLSLNYDLEERPGQQPLHVIAGGSSSGNPNLKPWRSTNYGASLEYYMSPQSMVSLAYFRIKVKSFINSGSSINCDLPDEDGVIRNRCVVITHPVQGTGNSIHGFEFDYKQAFTFLPGVLSHTGLELNGTYAPSNTGTTDLAGNSIPFADNSKKSGNVILWFQNKKFQARVALNYRSKRAVAENEGGISGMELYEAPQKYIAASVSYNFAPHVQLFVQGTNLTNQDQRFYLVWPDQEAHANLFERMYMIGIRGQF